MAEGLKNRVEAHNAIFMKHFSNGDFKSLAGLYTEDCVVMPPGADSVHGHEGVEKLFEGVKNSGISKLELKVEDVYGDGKIVVERSLYTMKKGDDIADHGKYIVVWKEIDGKLYLHNDIFNTSKS